MNVVKEFYDQDSHNEWARLDRHPTEFAVTMRALQEFLPPPPAEILDLGGGPGRYAIALAELGYGVTLVDLAPGNIRRAAENAQRQRVQLRGTHVANALDLDNFQDAAYDAVLLLGPLYHLIARDERDQAVQEATRVLKSDGLLFAGFLTRYSALRVCAERFPQWLFENPEYVERMLDLGIHQGEWGFTTSYYVHTDEIQPLMESHDLTTLAIVGCEGIVAHTDARLNGLDGAAWEWWADLNYRLGKRPDLHGSATHLLYAGRNSQLPTTEGRG
jgi:S-adenosylmethionine-dependent methyltransferase